MMTNEYPENPWASISVTAATNPQISEAIATIWLAALQRAEMERVGVSHANLLGWLLALPTHVDPAAAACAVLAQQQQLPQAILSGELMKLLQQVAVFPTSRLARMRRQHRRLNS